MSTSVFHEDFPTESAFHSHQILNTPVQPSMSALILRSTSPSQGPQGIFTNSSLHSGLSYAQTRDPKHATREYYAPLQTHIPGSGGGLNQSNFRLSGDGALFSSQQGSYKNEIQPGIFKSNFCRSGQADVDSLSGSLFSAFLNYGGIWTNAQEQNLSDANFSAAHGYT